MATTTVTDSSFDSEVLAAPGPVLVDFWAEWCGPCRMISPALEQISEELGGRLTIAKLNVDDNGETAARYGVRSIPTLILFHDGKPLDVSVGAVPKQQLRAWIEDALPPAPSPDLL